MDGRRGSASRQVPAGGAATRPPLARRRSLACRAALTSTACSGRGGLMPGGSSSCTCSRGAQDAPPRLGSVGLAQGRRRGRAQPGQTAAARGVRARERSAAGGDRRGGRGAPRGPGSGRAGGSEGVRRALSELVERAAPAESAAEREARLTARRPWAGSGDEGSAARRGCARSGSTSALISPALGASAASTTRRARSTRCRRSRDSAYSAGLSLPGGGCSAATPGATEGLTPSRISACSSLARRRRAPDHARHSPTSSSR